MTDMAKEYFSHDYNARNDPKLQEVLMDIGLQGIGAYWCVVEMLYEQGGKLALKDSKSIAFSLHVDKGVIDKLINDFGLFVTDEEFFWSTSVNGRIEARESIRQKKSEAGKRGNAVRWSNRKCDPNTSHSDSTLIAHQSHEVSQNIANKRKEKESKDIKELSLSNDKSNSMSAGSSEPSDPEKGDENSNALRRGKEEAKICEEIRMHYNSEIQANNSRLPIAKSRFSENRKTWTLARVKEYGIESVKDAITKATQSNFLNGDNNKGFVASYDWIMRPNNFPKVLDGNYKNNQNNGKNRYGTPTIEEQRDVATAAIREILSRD